MNRRSQGNYGETLASDYLEEQGFTIVKRNFHFSRFAEIDIIARKGDLYIFVEVKTDYSGKYGDPLLWITKNKIYNISKASQHFININKLFNYQFRFDVIILRKVDNSFKLEHIENSFESPI